MKRFPSRVSQRDVRNWQQGMSALVHGTVPQFETVKQRKPQGTPEKDVMSAIKDYARSRGDVTLWRNNVGSMEWAPGRWLRYGLCTGSSDFIGLTSRVIRPEDVGTRMAIFTAIEAKAEKGVVSAEQEQFIAAVRKAGGIAGVVRSAEDAERLLGEGG